MLLSAHGSAHWSAHWSAHCRQLLCLLVGLAAAQSGAAQAPLAVVQAAPGVYLHVGAVEEWLPSNAGDVANNGFIVGHRCVAVIDSGGTPEVGGRLRAAIAQATPLPICYVITTHAHPDHLLGNAAFADATPRPQFVASARYAAALAGRERSYRNAVLRDFRIALAADEIVYPDVAVERDLELDLGDRWLQLRAWPTAHTDNDLSVWDRQTRTLFLGDLLFVDHIPVLDGRLAGWLAVMAELRQIDVALAVPGHGAPGSDWPVMLAPQQAYLETLQRETRAAVRSHLTLRQTVEQSALPDDSRWLLAELFHRRNVTAAFAEIEWED